MQTVAQNVAQATLWLSDRLVRYYRPVLVLLLTGVLAVGHFLLLSSQIPLLLQLIVSMLVVSVAICFGAGLRTVSDTGQEFIWPAGISTVRQHRSRCDWDGELARITAEVNSLEDQWRTQQGEAPQSGTVDLSAQLPWLKAADSAGYSAG